MKQPLLVSLIASLTLSLSGVVLAAPGHGEGHHADSTIGQPGEAAEASRTVEVVMYDNYYEPEEMSVKAGETVRFVIKNEGMLVHEFNIGTAAMHAAHQDEMMMMVEHGVIQGDTINHEMMKMDMGNGQTMEHDDPNSVLLEPGETAEVVWTFGESTDLEFACNVPGHYSAGMVGPIDIQ
tara:strand:+ start:691 stop:1230 length:540 start_codon:yes stop_codon:yes gene_type:complete